MKTLVVGFKSGILNVQLNKPEMHNAFDPVMIEELTQIFSKEAKKSKTRAVVISGAGKSFCAGADLAWMKSMAKYDRQQNIDDSKRLFEMFFEIATCPVPVIGKVHGSVFGGGIGLVAACDVVAAVKETKFCFSEVKLGLVPAVISPFVLRKTIPGISRPFMMTAQFFDEEKAQAMGLVQFSGNQEEVDDYVESQVEFYLGNGPEAVRETKQLLNDIENREWSKIKSQTCRVIAERRVSPEGQEGLTAFFEKRKPNWKT
jgi:methylglutaconyl-CoA hydratase